MLPNKIGSAVENARKRLALQLTILVAGVYGMLAIAGGAMAATIGDGSQAGTWGLFFVFGAIIVLVLGVILFAAHAIPPHPGAVGGLMGFVVVLLALAFVVPALTPVAPNSLVNAPPGAALTSYISTTDKVAGCTIGAGSVTMTCTAVYNYTSNAFYLCSGNLSAGAARTACVSKNFIMVDIHGARSDILNSTYGFPFQVASLPTTTIVAGTGIGTVYSPITGYVSASGTTPGVWQSYWSLGSTANQKPQNAAPASATALTGSTTAVAAFGSADNVLHISLPGSNSTFAPTWGAGYPGNLGLTQFSSYSETFTVGNSNPSTFTLTVTLIGFST